MGRPAGAAAGGVGLYIHIPFCVHRCGYCDFVTWAGREHRADEYLSALAAEARRRAAGGFADGPAGPRAETVFLGGGTPSLLGPGGLRRIWAEVLPPFAGARAGEITVECNPESVTPALAAALVELGVHRVSLGAQSFDDEELRRIERAHDAAGIRAAVEALRAAGLPRLSLDLIYGLPGQTAASFVASLDAALALDPGHLSVYGLGIEPGSTWGQRGTPAGFPLPDGDEQADMYEAALARLRAAGYRGYEISNFARPGQESRHNLRYWRSQPVYGLGVGAWGSEAGRRVRNSADLDAYLRDQAAGRGPFAADELGADEAARERVVLGLRLAEGVDPAALQRPGEARRSRRVFEKFQAAGLVALEATRWRLTDRGRMLANEIMAELI